MGAARKTRRGSVLRRHGRASSSKTRPERAWLLALIDAEPDITLAALSIRLREERGVQADTGMLSRFPIRRDQLQKKSVLPCEQDRPDVARKRRFWKRYQANIDPTRLVFIDETWAKTNMTRTHGRCRKGERLKARVPHSHWKTLTFLAALRHDRITAPGVLDGPINGRSFFWPMSSSFWFQHSSRAISSCSTISAVTRAMRFARPFGLSGRG